MAYLFSIFVLIFCLGHFYSESFILEEKTASPRPPYCPRFTNEEQCLDQLIPRHPLESWCTWVSGVGCRWDSTNIDTHFCNNLIICQSPFCKLLVQSHCVVTSPFCLATMSSNTCREMEFCHWYKPGETQDNPNFPMCGQRLPI